MGIPRITDIDEDLYDEFGDNTCDRCGCCETEWEECYDCGGEGGRGYEDDLQFEDPLWYSPGDFETCSTCLGKGGWNICMGGCDEKGKHKH